MDIITASRILAKLESEDGFTFDVKTGLFIASGFSVSPYKQLESILSSPVTQLEILDYANRNRATLAKKDHFFGGWLSGNQTFLDVSIVVSSLRYALHLGKLNDQLSVFDLASFTEHVVQEDIEHVT